MWHMGFLSEALVKKQSCKLLFHCVQYKWPIFECLPTVVSGPQLGLSLSLPDTRIAFISSRLSADEKYLQSRIKCEKKVLSLLALIFITRLNMNEGDEYVYIYLHIFCALFQTMCELLCPADDVWTCNLET